MRTDGPAALWFKRVTARIHLALPAPLRRIIPLTFIGYAFINGSAFLLDMGVLLGIGHFLKINNGELHAAPWTTGVVFSIGYGIASIYAFILNRWLNFREHGDLGKQSGKYTAVIISNYLIWIWGAATLLTLLGMPLPVARVLVACCEGIYIYIMLRLWVFPRRGREPFDVEDAPIEPIEPAPQNSPAG